MTATHHADPLESVEAAERAAPLLSRNQATVLQFVHRWPGRTSKELARLTAATFSGSLPDRAEFGRRLPELEAMGKVHRKPDPNRSTPTREAYIGGRDGAFWWPGKRPAKQVQKELFGD